MRKFIAAIALALTAFASPSFADDVSDNAVSVTRLPKFFINPVMRGTFGLYLPKGTTAQRNSATTEGQLRYNTSVHKPEFYNGSAQIQLGTSKISTVTTTVSTGANTTETDGESVTAPAGILKNVGDELDCEFYGTTAANTNTKAVKLYFGGTAVYTTGAVAANNKDWRLCMKVVKTASNAQKIYIYGHFNGALVTGSTITTTTKTDTSALVIKNTMTNGSSNAADCVTQGMSIKYAS